MTANSRFIAFDASYANKHPDAQQEERLAALSKEYQECVEYITGLKIVEICMIVGDRTTRWMWKGNT